MMTRENLANLLKNNGAEAVIVAASDIIASGNPPSWVYLMRSEALWSTGSMGKALSDLHRAAELDPSEETLQRIKAIEKIIAFRNTDILNP